MKKIILNFHAYYQRFKVEHGNNPILHKGRLLFSDGWTYSSTDIKGPEWPPPDDPAELCKLQFCYWQRRSDLVVAELREIRQQTQKLTDFQAAKSIPLQQAIITKTDKGRKLECVDLNLDPTHIDYVYRGRDLWLRADMQECHIHLTNLRSQIDRDNRDG